MDLDAWINDPPSDSEDEAVPTTAHFENNHNQSLFSGDNKDNYYHGSNLDSYSGDSSSYNQSKTYVELTSDELEKQRESRKQSEKMNPFYLKDSAKSKLTQKVKFPKICSD